MQLRESANTFIKYCAVGAIGTAIDFGILLLLVEAFSAPVIASNTVSFIAAATNNYILNKKWTFKDSDTRLIRQYGKFLAVSAMGLIINSVLMYLMVRAGVWYVSAKAVIIAIVLFWNFIANSIWTFNGSPSAREEN